MRYHYNTQNPNQVIQNASKHHSSNGINLFPPPFLLHPPPHSLLAPPQIPPTKRLRPPLRFRLLPHLLQRLRIQPRIPSLRSIHALLARHVAHAAQDAAAGEGAANAFGDAALDGVDVFVAGYVGGEFVCGEMGLVDVDGEQRWGGQGRGRGEERDWKGAMECTFGRVGGFVLAPVSEDLILYPGHVFGVGVIVLLLCPLRHDCVQALGRAVGRG